MPAIRTTVRLRRTPEPAGDAGVGEVAGPYLAWCFKPWPTGDDKTMAFALHNLPASAEVAWELSPGGEFVEVIGPADRHVLVIKSQGSVGTVSATVNGQAIGSLAFDYGDCPE